MLGTIIMAGAQVAHRYPGVDTTMMLTGIPTDLPPRQLSRPMKLVRWPSTTTIELVEFEELEELPADLMDQIEDLEKLTSTAGWDDERGEPISRDQWERARLVLARYANRLSVFVSACGDGYIHLTWARPNGDRGVLEIGIKQWWWSTLRIDGLDDSPIAVAGAEDASDRIDQFIRG